MSTIKGVGWVCDLHHTSGTLSTTCGQCIEDIKAQIGKVDVGVPPLWIPENHKSSTPRAVTPSLMTLPTDSAERKEYPLYRGVLRYFPAALAGVAKISKAGNDKHNPGEELHHARAKSRDHADCILRHLIDATDLQAALERGDGGITPQDVLSEVSQLAWRVLALSQELHEKYGAPLAPGAKE